MRMVCLPPELTSDVTAKPKVEGLAQYSSSLDRWVLEKSEIAFKVNSASGLCSWGLSGQQCCRALVLSDCTLI